MIGPPPDQSSAPSASASSSVFGELKAKATRASADDIAGENVYTIVKYRNGFTINDGELLDSESTDGLNFFKRLRQNQVPRELEEMERAKGNGQGTFEATVTVVDKENEDYTPPPVSSKALFKKEGAQIGKKTGCGDANCLVFTETTTSADCVGPAPVHDAAQPSTQLAIKGVDGKTIKFKINSTLPVARLGAVLVQQLGLPHGGSQGFTISSGFPAKCIETKDVDKTLLEIGLTNAQLSLTIL